MQQATETQRLQFTDCQINGNNNNTLIFNLNVQRFLGPEVGSAVLHRLFRPIMELEQLQDPQQVCLQAKISTKRQTKRHMIRLICEVADKAIGDEEEEVAHEYLVQLIGSAKECKNEVAKQVS